MTPLGLDSVIVRDATLLSAEVGEAVVILHLDASSYLHTDAVGADIWRRLEVPVRVGDLVEALIRDYDVPAAECERDVVAFLEHARGEGVVRVETTGG